ncbi:MAG: FAD-dependent oxidoreductase, partial [Alphaproteobacteria bacterium]|nr:FAD-dependent oxidoreductase [Alphaproteobacteria bacterium]
QSYVNRIAELENVAFRWMSEVVEIIGNDGVEGIRMINREEGGAVERIDCSGVFVFIGLDPNSRLLAEFAELDSSGGVVTNETMETGSPGLFAVGAVRSGYRGRLVHAVGEAATAAMAAVEHSSS